MAPESMMQKKVGNDKALPSMERDALSSPGRTLAASALQLAEDCACGVLHGFNAQDQTQE